MSYSELENRIIELAGENPINIDEVKKLFDQGADPNAVDGWDENEQDYDDILFTDCTTLFDAPDYYQLLECFLKNGLDIKKYAERIIGDLIYMGDNDRFRLIQRIFDSLPERVSMQKALESVGEEASFYNCNPEFYKGNKSPEWESNDLEGMYELILAYENGDDYDGFKKLPEEINQKLLSVSVSGEVLQADEEKMVYRYKDNTVYMIIEMEQDTLIIKNGYAAFINSKEKFPKQKNAFTLYAESILKGEDVEQVSLHPYSFNVTDRYPEDGRVWYLDGRTLTVELSGGKKIVFTTSIDTDNDTVFLQV